MSEQHPQTDTPRTGRPAEGPDGHSEQRRSTAEEFLGVLKLLGMVAATVVLAVVVARLLQAFLTALGFGFG